MQEKQFDHIINRIREAAENVAPEFDDENWVRMEAMLDAEEKRRPAFWWWMAVFVVLTFSAVLLADQFAAMKHNAGVSSSSILPQKKASTTSGTTLHNDAPGHTGNAYNSPQLATAVNDRMPAQKLIPDPARSYNGHGHQGKVFIHGKTTMKYFAEAVSDQSDDNSTVAGHDRWGLTGIINEQVSLLQVKPSGKTPPLQKRSKNSKRFLLQAGESTLKHKALLSRFYLAASAGLENSNVKFLTFAGGQTQNRIGLGLGYQFNDRLAIQLGFGVSRKKYLADAKYYHVKAGSYWSMVDLHTVDANCLVYDIPVSLRYNFKTRQRFATFVTAGLSSLIMKREDYVYEYSSYGQPYTRPWTYTGNSKLFSNILLSAGAAYNIKPQLSAFAEPFISVPVAGVGDGRIKLHTIGINAGLQFSFKK